MDPFSLWCESLQAAWGLARGERLGELRGEYARKYDSRGLHPFSTIWGRVEAAQALEPALDGEGVSTSAIALRTLARADADREFRAEILEAA